MLQVVDVERNNNSKIGAASRAPTAALKIGNIRPKYAGDRGTNFVRYGCYQAPSVPIADISSTLCYRNTQIKMQLFIISNW